MVTIRTVGKHLQMSKFMKHARRYRAHARSLQSRMRDIVQACMDHALLVGSANSLRDPERPKCTSLQMLYVASSLSDETGSSHIGTLREFDCGRLFGQLPYATLGGAESRAIAKGLWVT
jgi:hypothetical protein